MNSKTRSTVLRLLSLALSFMMVISVIPVNGMVAFAAEEDTISIQYLSKNIVQEGVEIKIKPNDATDDSYIGKTDKYGIWKTEVLWKDLSESFYISINGDSKKIVRSDEPKSFLIVIDDEKKWTDEAMPVAVISIEADKTSVGRGESFEISSTVFGTPDKYQWYRDSQEIASATSSVLKIDNAAVTDTGAYSCKVIDINGDSRTSDSIEITVTEKAPEGLALKAYADGSEIDGPVSRDSVKEIELKLENIPNDAAVTDVAYYVNGNCVSSGTSETSYVFALESGVEEYTCEAELTFDKYYEQTKVALSAPVQAPLLSQSEIVITVEGAEYDAAEGAYVLAYSDSPKAKLEITVSGGSGDGEYKLELVEEKNSDGSNASYDGRNVKMDKIYGQDKWKVEIKNAGSFKFEASKEGDGNYEAIAPVSASFKVNKASAGDFAFATPSPEAVVYNENNNEFVNAIVGEFSDVKYEIIDGDCAVIDEATGKLSIKKAGIVTVKASLAESENYLAASAEYTLTVNKAAQTIKFEDKAATIYYGQSYSRVAAPEAVDGAADGYGYNHDEGVKPVYSIVVADGAEAIAAVAEDGSLAFENQKTGTVTVKAVLAGNDCYEAAEAEYTLTVEKYTVENAYSVSGEQLNSESGWYTGNVTVTPAEDHQISKTNNLGDTNEWSESLVISAEGVENGLDIYLKNVETGAISEVSTVNSDRVKIDKTAPAGLKVNYKTSVWYEDVLNSVTFGYYNSTVIFTLEAKDEISGIEYFVWSLVSHEDDENAESATIVPEIKVTAEKKGDVYESEACVLGDKNALDALCGKISFSAYDYAGHSEEYEDGYVIVIDTEDPEVSIETDASYKSIINNAYPYGDADENSVSPIEIYPDSVSVKFRVIEKNFFVQNATASVNGEDVTDELLWKSEGDNHYAVYNIEEDGDYSIVFVYEDIFGEDIENSAVKNKYELSKHISVDTVAPEVTVTLSEADFEAKNTKYYDETVSAEISVKEEKFNPANLNVSEVEGFDGMSEENKAHLAQSSSWNYNKETGVYTATIVFAAENSDGNYAFAVDYSDLAGYAAVQAESGKFVIDTKAPETAVNSVAEATITVNNNYPYETVEKDSEGSVDIFSDSTEIVFTVNDKNFFEDRATVKVNGNIVSGLAWSKEGDVHTATYMFNESGDYKIELSYEDIFNGAIYESSDFIAVDKDAPVINIALSKENTENNEVKYYNNDVTAVITVEEIRFRPSELSVSEVEGLSGMSEENKAYLAQSSSWAYDAENSNYTASVVFTAENADGNYAFAVDYTDLAGNAAAQNESGKFVVDTIKPVISVDYGVAKILDKQFVIQESLEDRDFKNTIIFDDDDIIVTVKIDEVNFDSDKAVAMLSVDGAEAKEHKFDGEWITEGTIHTNTITISEEDSYSLTIDCTDRSLNSADDYNSPEIVLSKELPSVSIEITTENDVENTYFNKDQVEVVIRVLDDYFDEGRVKVTAADKMATDINGKAIVLADADIIPDFSQDKTWTEGKNADGKIFHSATITLTTQARFSFSAEYENAVGSTSSANCSLVLDRTKPTHTITYAAQEAETFLQAVSFDLYNPSVFVKIKATDDISGVDKIDVEYPAHLAPGNAYNSDDFKTKETFFADDTSDDQEILEGVWEINKEKARVQAKAQIAVIATDNCRNSTDEEFRTDTQITGIDNIGPIISSDITVKDANGKIIDLVPGVEYDVPIVSRGITVVVKEANFVATNMNISVTAEDISENGVTVPTELLNDFFHSDANWTHSDDNFTHTIDLEVFNEINGKKFTLDDGLYTMTITGEDAAGNSEVSAYSTLPFIIDGSAPINPVFTYSTPKLAKLISAVTFNYYNAPVMVTLTAEDSTSGISRFDWTYTREKNASVSNVASQSGFYETNINHKFSIDEDGEAVIINDDDVKRTRSVEFRLPESVGKQYRGNISFTATDNAGNQSDNYTDTKNTLIVDTIAPAGLEVAFSEARNVAEGKRYYDDAATATITLTEANFYPEDVELKINDETYDGVTWTQSGDVWTGTVTISGDGHYILSISYSDRSTNKMTDYVSEEITIDTLPPEIDVKYSPEKGIYNTGDREYFDTDRTATITITEHNFDPSKVSVTLVAEDISGNAIAVDDITSKLASASSWSSDGDVHTATVTYSDSANYTFSISCADLSNRVSAEYTPDKFTVDKTPPENLDVKFSESILDTIIESISFGFYNAPVKVTVSADDDISGISTFTYTYTDTATGEVKTENIDVASNGSAHASKEFYVPADAAMFKGNVKVSATDSAGNKSSEYTEDKTIVVDTVAPVGNIELSTEVSSNNGILYYSGDVTATLVITEDNFYGEDVAVYVDGNAVTPSSWTSDGNTRTATVVVSADGEHRIAMSYTDKSSNKMEDVETAAFVIDHTAPVIVVSGIENNSANNAEKIGFTVRAEDTNFVASGFEAVLTAVVNNEDNKLVTERIDLSGGYSTGNGYSVEVDNLEKDGVYTLTCKAVDLCGNTTTTIIAANSGNAQLSVLRFSVNRNGSTFSVNDETAKIVDTYYVKSVDNSVVITETNVDPIVQYKLTMNGTELIEGEDYTTASGGGNGEWYINTYTIATSMFEQDGEYSIIVNSVDNANTESYSDIKGTKVAFVVDSSAPTITVSGMQANGRYQSDNQNVILVPADDGGSLQSVRVEITDADGSVLVPIDLSGEALEEYLANNNGQINFDINEGVRQHVRVICVDKAGNTFDSEQTYNDITVSSSKAVLVWESYGLYFILGGAGAVAAGIIIVILVKKKKNNEEK